VLYWVCFDTRNVKEKTTRTPEDAGYGDRDDQILVRKFLSPKTFFNVSIFVLAAWHEKLF
jgi:hypothetical protein